MRARPAAALLALLVGGCNFWYNEVPSPDHLMHAVPWFDHMIGSKAIYPYQTADVPRNTPPGIVPITGAEADWGTGNPAGRPFPTYNFDAAFADGVTRPEGMATLPAERGRELFVTYCSMCHGSVGAGGGTIPIPAPVLNNARVAGMTDGYLYSIIRYGRGLMPLYGDKIVRVDERWAVVDYVRSLQGGGAQ